MLKLPRSLPNPRLMLGDIPLPDAEIAKILGIGLRTLQRYMQRDDAPKPVALALFFFTRWGQAEVDVSTANELMRWRALATTLQTKVDELETYVREMEKNVRDEASNAARFTPGASRWRIKKNVAQRR